MKIFSTWKLPESAQNLIFENGFEVESNLSGELLTVEQLNSIDKDSSALITLLTDPIDEEIIKILPELKVIANVAVGYNNIDVRIASEKGIIVCNTPDILTDATADLASALVLSVTRQTVQADQFVRKGKFSGWRPDLFLGYGFAGKTFGIFGMGKIGQALGKRMSAFGCKILYHNRKPIAAEIEKELNAEYVDFSVLLKESDYLCVLSPLTPETEGRFGRDEFYAMKKGSCFFNVARGRIMDEKALVEVLKNGHLAAAGLDVYENEPEIEADLVDMNNVVLLPHIGSAEKETREKMFVLSAQNVVNVLNGKPALTPVEVRNKK